VFFRIKIADMSERIVLFGGSGFLGRALIPLLTRGGAVVRVATRHVVECEPYLKLLGLPGQVQPFLYAPKSDASLIDALRGADSIVNLVGELAENRQNTFQNIHVEFPARLARLARAAGVKRFVHISALGVGENSRLAYMQSKAAGEKAVRAFFPEAIIYRPSLIWGETGGFLAQISGLAKWFPVLPLFGNEKAEFQPVPINVAAEAVLQALIDPSLAGQTIELAGPDRLKLREMMAEAMKRAGREPRLIRVPAFWATLFAFFAEFLPNPPLTRDQLKLLDTGCLATKDSAAAVR
jgi:NADH dehydrogenase